MSYQLPDGIIETKEGFFVLKDDTHLSRWIEEQGRLDIAEGQIAFYRQHIPVGGIVIDAGASLGDHTLTYAKLVGPTGRVLAIEPEELSFEALKLNFDRWQNVICVRAVLSDSDGYFKIHREANVGGSHVSEFGSNVRSLQLDEYLNSLTACHLIHLDVEGFEVRALNGAWEIIKKFRPAIVLEINHAALAKYGYSEQAVATLLNTFGYDYKEIEPHHHGGLAQRDVIALPR
jgi:FkbM family methyltransferase